MTTFQFKTNIKCGGCVAGVTPFLNAEPAIKSWEVDTNDPQKVLTITAENLTETDIEKVVENAGFKAEAL